MQLTTKQRQKLRSKYWKHMKPHIFDKLILILPHVLAGIEIPDHYG
jgi:hypothetical protein